MIPQTTQLEWRQGPWFYRDIFDGEYRFQGREVIYFKEKPVWGMVYEGGIETTLSERRSEEIYKFLQKVLLKFSKTARITGKVHFREGALVYMGETNNQRGMIEKFWGEENITRARVLIYQIAYGGGWIK